MTEVLAAKSVSLEDPLRDRDITHFLRYSLRFSEIATLVKQDQLILHHCDQLGIHVSEAELQAGGDNFRRDYHLLSIASTQSWLKAQQLTLEDWTDGIHIQLLTQKLKDHLFGALVDTHYITNRELYRRVALSQILVSDLSHALKIVRSLQEEQASFLVLAMEYSQGKQSQARGGFMGMQFLAELLPELSQALAEAQAHEIVGPIQTKLGYHILRVEKWFADELDQFTRAQVLESLFQAWLQEQLTSAASEASSTQQTDSSLTRK